MKTQKSSTSVYETTIRLLFLLLIVGWCIMIMAPFVSIIIWSLILSFAMLPLHKTITNKIGNRPKTASFIIIVIMFLLVIVPAGFMITSLVQEVKELKVLYDSGELNIPPPNEKVRDLPIIGNTIYDTWNAASSNIKQTILKYQDQLTALGKTVGKGILGSTSAIIQFMIAFVIAGILLVIPGVSDEMRKFFRKVAGDRGDEFADTTIKTVSSVVKGVIGVALILALLHGLIFVLAGVPFAGMWTLFVFVLCVLQIPVIFVTLPIIVYLLATKGLTMAIVWIVLLFIAGLSDNVLKPLLLGKGAPVPMLVIFIGVIGGFIFSGFVGLFTGAIIMSLGYKLFIGWINSSDEERIEQL